MIIGVDAKVRQYLVRIGSRGGRKSQRTLSSELARQMVRVREARRAFRRFHTKCFWSYDPNYRVTAADVLWVARELMANGGRDAWDLGAKLCR